MLDYVIVGVYLTGILALGIWAGRGISSLKEYSVYKRSYSMWFIFATLSGSFIGGGFSTGNASKVFLLGIGQAVALWGFSLMQIMLAVFVIPRIKQFHECISVGEVMGMRYGKLGQIVTGLLGALVCAGIVGAQVSAMGIVFQAFLGMDRLIGILIGCSIVIVYTTLGGMRAIVLTDVIQFIILIVGIPLTLIVGIVNFGGIDNILSAVPPTHLNLLNEQFTLLMFISLFLSFLVGETLVPPYVQRLLIGRDVKETARGTLFSGLLSIPFFIITGMLGLVALAHDPSTPANLAMPHVVNTLLPIGVRGLVITAVISIIMSSADSFLNAASVCLIHDVYQPVAGGSANDKASLRGARIVTLGVGVLSIVVALKIENVLDILLFSYNFWAPVVLVPLVAALIGMRPTMRTFVLGCLSGLAMVVSAAFFGKGSLAGLDGVVLGVVANLLIFATSHWIDGGVKGSPRPCED